MRKENFRTLRQGTQGMRMRFDLRMFLSLLAFALPVLMVVFLWLFYGSNVPFWDEWDFLTPYKNLQENGLSLHYLWELFCSQHNEHHIFVAHLAYMLIWQLTHCNDIITTLVLYGLLVGAIFIIFSYCRQKQIPLIYLLPIPALAFSLRQGLMLFWPAFILTPFLIICVTASFYFYYKYAEALQWKYLLLSILFAFLATYCRGEGLVTWLAYAVFFLAQKLFENRKFFRKDIVCFFIVGMAVYAVYFYNWKWTNPGFSSKDPFKILKACIILIGGPFVPNSTEASVLWVAFMGGAIAISLFALLIYSICKEKAVSEMRFPFLMIAFYLGGTLMTAFGRDNIASMSSQYMPMSFWFYISLYLGMAEKFSKKNFNFEKLSIASFCVFFIFSIGFYHIDAKPVLDRLQATAYCVQNWDKIPDGMARSYVYPVPEAIEERVDWIKKNHYFLFNSEKKYSYPFEDYFIAEKIDAFVLPPTEEPVGNFVIDSINGALPPDGIITVGSNEGLNFEVWALDNTHDRAPVGVVVEIAGNYYELKQRAREDVAAAFSNNDYLYSGFRGYIATRNLESGEYPIRLIVLCDGGYSYYSTVVATAQITS